MSDFDLSATARCQVCGAYLSSSDEACDHDGQSPSEHLFREITGGDDPDLIAVRAVGGYHWQALKNEVDDDWRLYEWVGRRSSYNPMNTRATMMDAPDELFDD